MGGARVNAGGAGGKRSPARRVAGSHSNSLTRALNRTNRSPESSTAGERRAQGGGGVGGAGRVLAGRSRSSTPPGRRRPSAAVDGPFHLSMQEKRIFARAEKEHDALWRRWEGDSTKGGHHARKGSLGGGTTGSGIGSGIGSGGGSIARKGSGAGLSSTWGTTTRPCLKGGARSRRPASPMRTRGSITATKGVRSGVIADVPPPVQRAGGARYVGEERDGNGAYRYVSHY